MQLKDLLEGNESIISCDESEECVDDQDHKRAVECLTGLSDDDKVILNRFSNIQWIQVVQMISRNPDLKWEEIARGIGRCLLQKIQEAEKSQYESIVSSASPSVSASPSERDSASLGNMARWTPLRLVWAERELLRLLEAALYISDYTDNVDTYNFYNQKQMIRHIRHICSVLTGLVVARNYEQGQRLIKDKEFKDLAGFFQACFEIGRRYKILNPERMRDSYGKLLYFLMDSRIPSVAKMLEFDCVAPVKTVWQLLEKKFKGLDLLDDPLLIKATKEIYSEGLTPWQVKLATEEKENATKQLIRKYAAAAEKPGKQRHTLFSRLWSNTMSSGEDQSNPGGLQVPRVAEWESDVLTNEDVELAVYSLKDHHTFLRFSERPVNLMLQYLQTHFDPQKPEPNYNLGIQAGVGGARLSHQHERQYQYVKQSLLLWRETLKNFLRLWSLADKDMLDSKNPYQRRETGQGLNRIQSSPSVYSAFCEVVSSVQRQAGGWVGSSVIHLGDRNVPNALMFIDKYIQIPRFINPIVQVLDNIPKLYAESSGVKLLVDHSFGSVENLRKIILSDFFRHGFDGSGADNFFDAGSCIDGRLTSAWNWCQQIEKKIYYPIFLLAGFTGFDGKF